MSLIEQEENLNTDVEQVSSEPTQETQTPEPSPRPEAKASEANNVPFHEHPRFKEVIEEKNRYREELNAQRAQLAELQKQFQAAQTPKQEAPKIK